MTVIERPVTAESGKVVTRHDFSRTDLLERADVQSLTGLFETFTRSATQRFTTAMRTPITLEVEKLDQTAWRDLLAALEPNAYFFTFVLPPLTGRGALIMPVDEVLALVDVRLAGTGDDDFTGRMPGEIDQAFLETIVGDVLTELGRAISRFQPTTPTLETQESNPQFVSVGAPTEMFLVTRVRVAIAERPARSALLCLPFTAVRLIVDGLRARSAGAESRESVNAEEVRGRLGEVPLDVVFQFPDVPTTPAELLELRVGDTLGLGHPKGRPLEVRAGGLLIAYAEICASGVHKACEVREEVLK